MKIACKFILALILGICAVLAVNAYVRAKYEFWHFEEVMREKQHNLGLTLAIAVKDLWEFADEERIIAFIEEINKGRKEVGIRWVWLDAPPESPNAPLLPREMLAPLDNEDEFVWLDRKGGIHYSYTRVNIDGAKLSAIELTESTASETEYKDGVIRRVLITTLVVLGVYSLIVVALGFWIVARPIRSLIGKARRVGEGDLTGPLVLRQHDEFSELARELNTMCERLSEARERLAAETSARIATIEQLRHADRLITVGTLASGIAHELGSPLNVALARAKMVRSGAARGEAAMENSRIVVEQLDRMTKIIRQLLDFARPHSAKRAQVKLSQIARQTLDLLRPIAEKRRVSLTLEEGDQISANVDADQLQQVMANLVVNGIQAMEAGGDLKVEIRRTRIKPPPDHGGAEGEYICVSVRDQGVGIPPENLARLFEPFFTTKGVGEGTGLGLSVSYGIMKEHGGWISVESEVGIGSCFSIYLPGGKEPCPAAS